MDILTYAKIKMCKVKEMKHSDYNMKIFPGITLHIGFRIFQDEIILCAKDKGIK